MTLRNFSTPFTSQTPFFFYDLHLEFRFFYFHFIYLSIYFTPNSFLFRKKCFVSTHFYLFSKSCRKKMNCVETIFIQRIYRPNGNKKRRHKRDKRLLHEKNVGLQFERIKNLFRSRLYLGTG